MHLESFVMLIQRMCEIQHSAEQYNGDENKCFKAMVTLRRPLPRAAATIGAWLNIWQVTWIA
ncbi:hypothetical protein Bca4012_061689 [Brassica carinata]